MKIANLVKNHHLSKSISNVSWYQFTIWLEYYAKLHGIVCVAVPPHFTSQEYSNCGQTVKKSLSVRTHKCPHCGYIADRDHNAARNILAKGLEMLGAIVNCTKGDASCLLRRSCANGGAASYRGATLTLTESGGEPFA
ncbi:RNA-guided endonuclease InsQ/TnpB family protein [Dapis sp. BLCC M229]|uniref:RNA-guided endonuclease InsQ/TnpB family protein n=1 Tax=Dapis sp. BLCC M229 TaxID=3400188 RepID=UPI003CF89CFC